MVRKNACSSCLAKYFITYTYDHLTSFETYGYSVYHYLECGYHRLPWALAVSRSTNSDWFHIRRVESSRLMSPWNSRFRYQWVQAAVLKPWWPLLLLSNRTVYPVHSVSSIHQGFTVPLKRSIPNLILRNSDRVRSPFIEISVSALQIAFRCTLADVTTTSTSSSSKASYFDLSRSNLCSSTPIKTEKKRLQRLHVLAPSTSLSKSYKVSRLLLAWY